MKLISRKETGWVRAVIAGRYVFAKVYDEPSIWGINDGRVSKLQILTESFWESDKPFFPQVQYNYSRGLDFDNLPEGLLLEIVTALESLPALVREVTK